MLDFHGVAATVPDDLGGSQHRGEGIAQLVTQLADLLQLGVLVYHDAEGNS